jgi:predicted RNA-binding Zn ribbon-like protein
MSNCTPATGIASLPGAAAIVARHRRYPEQGQPRVIERLGLGDVADTGRQMLERTLTSREPRLSRRERRRPFGTTARCGIAATIKLWVPQNPLPSNSMKSETVVYPPSAANMRFDGGHPALELVNTVYGPARGPADRDVLATPDDLVTFARRLDLAQPQTPSSAAALAEARALRSALDALLRAHVSNAPPPEGARASLTSAAHAAIRAAHLAPHGDALAWTWPRDDPYTPVHRLAHAAVGLLTNARELARLHQCAGCRWLFVDHSRGTGRRWCSMADCGTEAKKRRYVQRRRERQRQSR